MLTFAPQFERTCNNRFDSLAQQVEHNTFNVGVLGSSPKRITNSQCKMKRVPDNHTVIRDFYFIFTPLFTANLCKCHLRNRWSKIPLETSPPNWSIFHRFTIFCISTFLLVKCNFATKKTRKYDNAEKLFFDSFLHQKNLAAEER